VHEREGRADARSGGEAAPEPDVVAVLVDNHRAFLAFLERRVGSRDVAEDLLHEAFARALDRLPAVASEESAVAWFYRVLRNAIVDRHRRGDASARAVAALASEVAGQVEPALDTRDAVCRCVVTLSSTLKPEYADALRRVDVDGVPVREYAAEAGITPNNAGVRLFRAREALRRRVAQSCGACAEHGCVDCTCRGPA
jgi:RNA polymerase sigma-70 factor (ECF subfamily)